MSENWDNPGTLTELIQDVQKTGVPVDGAQALETVLRLFHAAHESNSGIEALLLMDDKPSARALVVLFPAEAISKRHMSFYRPANDYEPSAAQALPWHRRRSVSVIRWGPMRLKNWVQMAMIGIGLFAIMCASVYERMIGVNPIATILIGLVLDVLVVCVLSRKFLKPLVKNAE